jgi:hypothetical protein
VRFPGARRPSWQALAASGLVLSGAAMTATAWLSPGLPSPPGSLPGPAPGTASPAPPGRAGEFPARPRPPESRPAVTRPAAIPEGTPPDAPVQVRIPVLAVLAPVIGLGQNPDGTVAVPPLSQPQLTSWFDDGPAPGQPGPAAIFGHVDTAATGPAVFYHLADLRPGDEVDITRGDRRVLAFTVYRVAQYPKKSFPTMAVYGDTPGPELRLITCGGTFNPATGSYESNVVAYARLATVTPPLRRSPTARQADLARPPAQQGSDGSFTVPVPGPGLGVPAPSPGPGR